MIKAVLFDLDGTLADSLSDLADSTNFALSEMGFPLHGRDEYKYLVGDGIPKLIERALPEGKKTEQNKKQCFDIFMIRYKEHYHDKTVAYDGITDMLSELKANGLKIAVISNKAEEMAVKVTEKLFGSIFDVVAGKREGFRTKPDPALTLEVIRQLGVKPQESVLVGDSGMDMAASVNAGATGIGVLWGFRLEDELLKNGARYIVKSPAEIPEIIGKMNNG